MVLGGQKGNKYLEGVKWHKSYEFMKLQGVLKFHIIMEPKTCPIICELVVVIFSAYLLQFFIVSLL